MKRTTIQITFLTISAALVAVFFSSCGTIHGFGHDVETVGSNIEASTR